MKRLVLTTLIVAISGFTAACNDSAGAKATGDAGPAGSDAASAKGCAYPDAAAYDPKIDPAKFSTTVDNPYFPLVPGTTFESADADGNVNEFEVTTETKVIVGVTCLVIHDVAKTSTGDLIEDTHDWLAQDDQGNVWYFGEETGEYQNGKVVTTAGSWTAGVDCAKPGIIMEAHPTPGDSYREEYYAGEAEDQADVLSVTEVVEVPYNTGDAATGTYTNCLKTKNYTALEPGNVENKWYCAGLGEVRSQEVKTVGGKVEELVAITHK
jgi:predicted small secreted protein